MTVFAAGLAWLSVAGAHGSFTADLLGPTLLVGLGLGGAFVPVAAVAVANVPGGDAGIAGGLVNTSQQIGGAVGLGALAALATARTSSQSAAGVTSLTALTSGYSWAFLAAAAVAAGRVHVAELGSGPPVLLMHGFPESWYSWRYQLPAQAAAGYRGRHRRARVRSLLGVAVVGTGVIVIGDRSQSV